MFLQFFNKQQKHKTKKLRTPFPHSPFNNNKHYKSRISKYYTKTRVLHSSQVDFSSIAFFSHKQINYTSLTQNTIATWMWENGKSLITIDVTQQFLQNNATCVYNMHCYETVNDIWSDLVEKRKCTSLLETRSNRK